MFHRRQTGLQVLGQSTGGSLARLGALDGFARAVLVGVVPLMALEALGSKEAVTRAYLLASILTLCITLNFATLERILRRRRVVMLAGAFLVGAAAILYFGRGLEFALGISMRSAAASLFSVCMSLYIMDYIGKRDLSQTESRRMFHAGAAWMSGPVLGVWLWNHAATWSPFLLSAFAALLMVAYFLHLRFGDNPVIRRAARPAVNPLRIIPRYFGQRSLRIAYGITLSRSIFWVTLFVYGPLYVVEAGLPSWMAGGLLSFVSALMFLSPLVKRLADLFGIRRLIIISLTLCGACVFGLFLVGQARPVGLVFWVLASLGAICLDVLGNIPFMRSVKPRERTEMTMIFSTWREGSELMTPLIVTLVLLVAPFEAYYVILAAMLLFAAWASSFLPRRI